MSDTPRTDAIRRDAGMLKSITVNQIKELERENASLKEALDAQMQYQRELRADRDRLDWLLTYEGRTWFFRTLDNDDRIASMGDVRRFIDSAMGVKP